MNRVFLNCLMVFCLLSALLPMGLITSADANPSIIRVPMDFLTIGEAVSSASDGDTIFVYNGTYHENLLVNKSLSLLGENSSTTIIDGSGGGTVIEVAADDVNITGFTILGSQQGSGFYGVHLNDCTGGRVTQNIVKNSQEAILVYLGSNNSLTGNLVEGNSGGIRLDSSSFNLLQNNALVRNGKSFGVWGSAASHFVQYVDDSNTVDGKRICYWVDRRDEEVPGDAGYVALVNSKNITVRDLVLRNNWDGIMLFNTTESSIESSQISNNSIGVRLTWPSAGNVIGLNNITDNSWNGVLLLGSSDNTLAQNTLANNGGGGIFARDDPLNHVNPVNNTFTLNVCDSIVLWPSNDSRISSNTISSSTRSGISLIDSYGNEVVSNHVSAVGGGIDLSSSQNNVVANNSVTGGAHGVLLYKSYGNVVCDNRVGDSGAGVLLDKSSGNSIYQNDVADNGYGFYVLVSSNNTVFHNNVLGNADAVFAFNATNAWDDGYPSGGNYWSDYDGLDVYSGPYQNETGYDWIGDTPYVVGGGTQGDRDNYPLVYPFVPQAGDVETLFRAAFRSLWVRYTDLRSDFEALNSTYSALSTAHAQLASQFESLNSSYYRLLGDYDGVLVDLRSMNASYQRQLLELQALNARYSLLGSAIDGLQGALNALNESYYALNATFNDYRESVGGELSLYRSLAYVFIAVAAMLIAVTVYSTVRKPGREAERERGSEPSTKQRTG